MSQDLPTYQRLRELEDDERIDAMLREFFAPPRPCDTEYSILERMVAEEMAQC